MKTSISCKIFCFCNQQKIRIQKNANCAPNSDPIGISKNKLRCKSAVALSVSLKSSVDRDRKCKSEKIEKFEVDFNIQSISCDPCKGF